MSNVVPLPNCALPPDGQSVLEIVEILETALAAARCGQLQGVAIVTVVFDGTDAPLKSSTWHFRCKSSDMVWGVTSLFHRFCKAQFA